MELNSTSDSETNKFYAILYLGHDNDRGDVREYRFDVTSSFSGYQPHGHSGSVASSVTHGYSELKRLSWDKHPFQVYVRLTPGRGVWWTRQIFDFYHIAAEIYFIHDKINYGYSRITVLVYDARG